MLNIAWGMDHIQAKLLFMIRWDEVTGLDPDSPFKLLQDEDKLFGSLGISIKEPPVGVRECIQNSTPFNISVLCFTVP